MVPPLSLCEDNFSSTRTILMVLDFLERGDQCACFKTNLKRFHRREKDLESDENFFFFFGGTFYIFFGHIDLLPFKGKSTKTQILWVLVDFPLNGKSLYAQKNM